MMGYGHIGSDPSEGEADLGSIYVSWAAEYDGARCLRSGPLRCRARLEICVFTGDS
jgi:hypothetical protein